MRASSAGPSAAPGPTTRWSLVPRRARHRARHGMSALGRRISAEFLGSLLLAALVVGSGIAAQRLSPSDVGLQLLENALATALGLFAIILIFAPVSGAHFNPVVSLVDAALGYRSWRDVAAYLPAQVLGCVAGAIVANLMFALPAASISSTERLTAPHLLAEVIATAGLVLVIFSLARSGRANLAPAAVGAYIGAASSSRVPPVSRTRRSPSAACSPTRLPASHRPPRRDTSPHSSPGGCSASPWSDSSTRIQALTLALVRKRPGRRRRHSSSFRSPRSPRGDNQRKPATGSSGLTNPNPPDEPEPPHLLAIGATWTA